MPVLSRRFFGVSAALAVCLLASGAGAQSGGTVALTGVPLVLTLPPFSPAAGGSARLLLVLDGVRRSVAQPALYDLFWLADPAAADGWFVGTLSLFGLPSPETLPAAQGRTQVFDVTGFPLGSHPALRFVPGPGAAAETAGRVVIDRIALETVSQ